MNMRRSIQVSALTLLVLAATSASASAEISAIVYNGSGGAEGRSTKGVYAAPVAGGGEKLLVPDVGGFIELSPDNKRLAFVTSKPYGVVTSKLDGSDRQVGLTLDPSTNGFYGGFGYGPGALVFGLVNPSGGRADSITVVNSDGSNRRVVHTLPEGNEAGSPEFSPSGDRIVYSQFAAEGGVDLLSGIVTLGADGSNPTQVTSNTSDGSPTYSPDGSKIAFTRCFGFGPGSQCDVLTMNANGTGVVNITNSPDLVEGYPTYSPDGSQIAFEVEQQIIPLEEGGFNRIPARIDIANADGSGRLDFTGALPGEEFSPAWGSFASLPDVCGDAKRALKKAKKKLAKLKKKDASAPALKKAKKKIKAAKKEQKAVC